MPKTGPEPHGFSPRGLVFRNGKFEPSHAPALGDATAPDGPGGGLRIWLPGLVNAHSHAFQRVLRGRVEGRGDDFWGWRERMYHAALQLGPDDVRVASRAAYLEMALAGFTGVVEFHYLHHDPGGRPYANPNELALAVLDAAADVGIRICLLATAYARGGFEHELDPAQRRFADATPEDFLRRAEALESAIASSGRAASFGIALHSVRALPRAWLREIGDWARARQLTVHAHVAEQLAEVQACLAEHGRRPLELLVDLEVLDRRFTAVHAVYLSDRELAVLAASGAAVCACPSTEANLADGFVPAAALASRGVPLCVGTDSHASIDPFAELRELDYRERLRLGRRVGVAAAPALLEAATANGARAAGWEAENLAGDWASLDGTAPALAGASPDNLPGHVLVAGSPALVREVRVDGRAVVEDGRHPRQEPILEEFRALQARLWS